MSLLLKILDKKLVKKSNENNKLIKKSWTFKIH